MQSKIPPQLLLSSFSLNKNTPNRLELTTIPMLTSVNTTELFREGFANAFKKNTNEKKFGTPKIIPQNILFNWKGFFVFGFSDSRL